MNTRMKIWPHTIFKGLCNVKNSVTCSFLCFFRKRRLMARPFFRLCDCRPIGFPGRKCRGYTRNKQWNCAVRFDWEAKRVRTKKVASWWLDTGALSKVSAKGKYSFVVDNYLYSRKQDSVHSVNKQITVEKHPLSLISSPKEYWSARLKICCLTKIKRDYFEMWLFLLCQHILTSHIRLNSEHHSVVLFILSFWLCSEHAGRPLHLCRIGMLGVVRYRIGH